MDHSPPKRVLVFCLSGLGDTIMASPALAALAAKPDRFRLTLLTMLRSVHDYLRDQPFGGDTRFVDFLRGRKLDVFRALGRLRRERFDISIIPYAMNRLEYNAVSWVVGARLRIGFRYQKQRVVNLPFLNHCVLEEQPALHAVQENLRWAGQLLGADPATLPDDLVLHTPPAAEQAAEAFLRERGLSGAAPLIAVHASCNTLKNQQKRCWPAEKYAALIQRVREREPHAQFLLFEGPADAQVSATVCERVPFVVMARQLPMATVGALIRRCQLFLCNLSGIMHIAAACRVPTVAIYGPTNHLWDYPWKCPHLIVRRGLPCSPCFYYGSRPLDCPARLDYACVRDLPVEDVERAVWQLLRQPSTVPVEKHA